MLAAARFISRKEYFPGDMSNCVTFVPNSLQPQDSLQVLCEYRAFLRPYHLISQCLAVLMQYAWARDTLEPCHDYFSTGQ